MINGKLTRFLSLLLALALLSGCAMLSVQAEEKKTVICTLFPQYDFVRQITKGAVNLTLLLPPGAESHTYEPTPQDMLAMQNADLIVLTGEEMEPWAWRMLDSIDTKSVDASAGVELVVDDHDDHDGHDHEEDDHQHGYDPHIWLDPTLAAIMVDNIAEGLCEIDESNADAYRANAESYKAELALLDKDIQAAVDSGARDTIIFGGRFAFGYFVRRYDLHYHGAYDSCGANAEPSVRTMRELIETIEENAIPVVYYEELSDPKVARTLAEESGAKPLLLHSAHNVTPEDFAAGITYLDIMRANLDNLKEGLN